MYGNAGLAGDDGQQVEVLGREGFAGRTRGQDQLADPFLLIRQGQMNDLGRGQAEAGNDAWLFLKGKNRNRCIRQPQSLHERFDNGLQNRIRCEHRLEALAELREHGRRVVAIPVHQTVYGTLQSPAQRLKENSDHPGREERDDEIRGAMLEIIREKANDDDIEQDCTC